MKVYLRCVRLISSNLLTYSGRRSKSLIRSWRSSGVACRLNKCGTVNIMRIAIFVSICLFRPEKYESDFPFKSLITSMISEKITAFLTIASCRASPLREAGIKKGFIPVQCALRSPSGIFVASILLYGIPCPSHNLHTSSVNESSGARTVIPHTGYRWSNCDLTDSQSASLFLTLCIISLRSWRAFFRFIRSP